MPTCTTCLGDQTVVCAECQGTGRRRGGGGARRCPGCRGSGRISCERCRGTGQEPTR